MAQRYSSKYFCLFPLRRRETCFIFDEKKDLENLERGGKLAAPQAGRVF